MQTKISFLKSKIIYKNRNISRRLNKPQDRGRRRTLYRKENLEDHPELTPEELNLK